MKNLNKFGLNATAIFFMASLAGPTVFATSRKSDVPKNVTTTTTETRDVNATGTTNLDTGTSMDDHSATSASGTTPVSTSSTVYGTSESYSSQQMRDDTITTGDRTGLPTGQMGTATTEDKGRAARRSGNSQDKSMGSESDINRSGTQGGTADDTDSTAN